jgi:hypothetical protein
MTVNRYVQLFAGIAVLVSVTLGAPGSPLFLSAHWLKFTAFLGFMLAQSSVTGFCPMASILRALGVGVKGCAVQTD